MDLLSLDHGLPAGIDHLVRGLLGYLDPSTYLRISLGNTLLRTYADGSLPGSDIVGQLIGMDPASVLTLANSVPETGTGSTASPASGIGSPLAGLLGSLPGLGGFAGSSTQRTNSVETTNTNSVETTIENTPEQVVTLRTVPLSPTRSP